MAYNRYFIWPVNPEIFAKRLFPLDFRQFPSSIVLLLILFPAPVFAWGTEGHEIVALIAARELDPAARTQVAHLLGSEAMLVQDANWADEIRDQRRDTGAWHYVDIPLGAPGYDARRDCPANACVVAQIENDLRTLRNAQLSKDARAEALRFLVHFVADVHQPLHAEDNDDKGGNQVRVEIGRERTNLHRVWDADVVEALGFDAGAAADNIERGLSPAQRKAWAAGTPADWANESHAIASDAIYPPLMGRRELRLPRDYIWRNAGLTRMLLAKAGLRLAWLLNSTLK
jgi:hypothetical protein